MFWGKCWHNCTIFSRCFQWCHQVWSPCPLSMIAFLPCGYLLPTRNISLRQQNPMYSSSSDFQYWFGLK